MKWVANLDSDRFGSWVVIEADSEEEARKKLTRAQRRKVTSIRPSYPTWYWREVGERGEDHE